MKILIVGNKPDARAGVVNYTRPLAEGLSKKHEVVYLHSNWKKRTGWKMKIDYEADLETPYPVYGLVNGRAYIYNYDHLKADYGDWFDALFDKFLNDISPDIVHFNEVPGFSSKMILVARRRGIPVVNTIHEYTYLCPHRVMVDFNRRVCEGPYSAQKCSYCIKKHKKHSSTYTNLKMVAAYKLPRLIEKLENIYNWLRHNARKNPGFDIGFGDDDYKSYINKDSEEEINNRLKVIVSHLNHCNLIIGVSTDVKTILTKYGINAELIKVQHIGSLFASRNVRHTKRIDKEDIIFGFIGGVSYFKGVHQLVDAFVGLPEELKRRSRLEIFGGYCFEFKYAIDRKFLLKTFDKERVTFHGRFEREDLPQITNQFDISVLPSLCADTAPQTIFESYSSGLPIIGPSFGGFPDFINDGKNGLLFDGANVDSLREKLKTIIENPVMIKEFQCNIPKMITMTQHIDDLENTYIGVIEKQRSDKNNM